ncbi:hypothetical protein C2E25_04520 [Geothermobacter hydrogeniphilus]|uniref:Uncharacterized protein n=2 Tax=Geothermobacter hydrogeniphilus TaxID=1969733 RepID=A0A2K2HCT5_9BACT|nr:hypothetical protein C2E25_04520 [Geothermobacter hydrogeniphilus]
MAAIASVGHDYELSYEIAADRPMSDVAVSFYLVNRQEYDQTGDPADVDNMALLGVDMIPLSETEPMTRILSFPVPAGLVDGDYYLQAYINEYQDDGSSEADFTTTGAIQVSAALANQTNLRITDFSLDKATLVLDPYVDDTNVFGVNLSSLQAGLGSIVNDPVKLAALGQGLVSDAELTGTVELRCDGPLPANPAQLKFQINLNGSWQDLEYWDNLLQDYATAVRVNFPAESEAADYNTGLKTATVDVDINVTPAMLSTLINQLAANVNAASLLDSPNRFMVRVLVESVDDTDPADNSLETAVNVYSLPAPTTTLPVPGFLQAGSVQPSASDRSPVPVPLSVSTGSSGNDRIYEKSWEKWVGKKKKFKAGVEYYSKYALYNSTKRGVYGKTELTVPIYVLGKRRTMVDAYFRAASYINRPAYTGYKYNLGFFLNTLVDKELWGSHFPLKERGYTWSREKTIGKFKFVVGPIPFKVDVAVDGQAGYSMGFGVLEDGLFLENQMPQIDFNVIADGGPTLGVVSSGITASLMLIEETVDATANLRFNYDSGSDKMLDANLDFAVDNEMRSISGKFGLYVQYRKLKGFKFVKRTARLWIYNTDTLYSKTTPLYRVSESLSF